MKKWEFLNLGPNILNLDIFRLGFEKRITIFIKVTVLFEIKAFEFG